MFCPLWGAKKKKKISSWTIDLDESGNRTLTPFVKIIQNFILMQNTLKRDYVGNSEIFGTLFPKKKVLFLVNIRHCPNFLD